MLLQKHMKRYGGWLYLLFRVLLGFLFFQHGAQKLLGWFGGTQVASLFTLGGLSGTIEFLVGIAIFVGFFTRLAAGIAFIELVIAYFMVHAGRGLVPIMNGGELALIYAAAFLVPLIYGAGKWSLEKKISGSEYF